MKHAPQTAILHGVPTLVPYAAGWELQRRLVAERLADHRDDTLILLEHEPVFTLGRRAHIHHLHCSPEMLRRQGYDVQEIERGGSVTYHGPGQIVGYPILRLRDYCPGPKAYVDMLEEVVIRLLADWGITGRRIPKWRGVWVGDPEESLSKIAAVGVRITKGVTMHGFALNVNVDLTPFNLITPCGIEGCRVTSLKQERGTPVEMADVRQQLADHFSSVFQVRWKAG